MAHTTSCKCSNCGGSFCTVANGPSPTMGTCPACRASSRLRDQYGDGSPHAATAYLDTTTERLSGVGVTTGSF